MTIGAIDPEQRRVAERLVLASLRQFHREQPLSVDLRMDSLVSRVRAAAGRKPPPRHRGSAPLTLEDAELRRVIEEMADDGRLTRNGRRVGLPGVAPSLEPEMAERVDRLMEGLRSAGASPPRVDGLASRLGIPPSVLDQLRAGGQLRQIAPGDRLSGRRVVCPPGPDRGDARTDEHRPPPRRSPHQPPPRRGDPCRATTRGRESRPRS